MKKVFSLVLAVVMAFSMAACSSGVSQEEYDALKAELDSLKSESSSAAVDATAEPTLVPAETGKNEEVEEKLDFYGFTFSVPSEWEKIVKDENTIQFYPEKVDGKTTLVLFQKLDGVGIPLKGNEEIFFSGYGDTLNNYTAISTKSTDFANFSLTMHACAFTQNNDLYIGWFAIFDLGDFLVSVTLTYPMGNEEKTDPLYDAYEKIITKFSFDGTSVDAKIDETNEEIGSVESVSDIVPTQKKFSVFDINEENMYGTYALEITNTTNATILINHCEIDLLGADGKILARADNYNVMPGSLKAGEKAYVGDMISIESTTNPDDIIDMRVRIVGDKTDKYIPAPEFSNLNAFVNSWDEIEVTGEVKNTTGLDIDMLPIMVVLFGEDDDLIAANFASASDLKSGESSSFETTFWDDSIDLDTIKRVEAYGYDYSLGF